MHATQRTARVVEGDAALNQLCLQALLRHLALAPSAREKTPGVLERLRFDNERAAQCGLDEDHEYIFTSGIGTTKRAPQSRT